MKLNDVHPPCANVKTNRLLIFGLATFCIGWMSWLSLSYINIKLDSRVALATINVKLVNIQRDLIEIKKSDDSRTKQILEFINKDTRRQEVR